MKFSISTLIAMAIATSLSVAQEPPTHPGGPTGPKRERPSPEEAFKKLDTNNDGTLSLEEFKAGPRGQKNPTKAEEIFKKIDTNSDGKVTLEEFKAHRPPHHPAGPGAPEAPAPGGAEPATEVK